MPCPEALPERTTLGAIVRGARTQLGMSIDDLARESGLSVGIISKIERGRGNPALSTLSRLAGALGMTLPDLLRETHDRSVFVVQPKHRIALPPISVDGTDAGLVRELLTPRWSSSLQLIRSELPPGFSNEGRPFRHLGLESVHVIRGCLRVVTDDQEFLLNPGDTITYDCSRAHFWANPGSVVAEVIGAVVPLNPYP